MTATNFIGKNPPRTLAFLGGFGSCQGEWIGGNRKSLTAG